MTHLRALQQTRLLLEHLPCGPHENGLLARAFRSVQRELVDRVPAAVRGHPPRVRVIGGAIVEQRLKPPRLGGVLAVHKPPGTKLRVLQTRITISLVVPTVQTVPPHVGRQFQFTEDVPSLGLPVGGGKRGPRCSVFKDKCTEGIGAFFNLLKRQIFTICSIPPPPP